MKLENQEYGPSAPIDSESRLANMPQMVRFDRQGES